MTRAHLIAIILVAAALLCSSPVSAQDPAAAEALFEQGLAAMEAGRFDEACPALDESQRLDPRPGTLFTLAECLAQAGKVASAASRYQDYLNLFLTLTAEQQERQADRPTLAEQARARLEPEVPRLTLKLGPGAPPDVVVKRNDTLLAGASLGVPLPIDPGEYVVTTQAPGGDVTTVTITIAKGEQLEVTLEVKRAEPLPDRPGAEAEEEEPRPQASASDDGDPQRVAAYVVGGVGLASLVIGAITGGLTVATKSSIEDDCDLDARVCQSPDGLDAVERAHTTGIVSTVAFVVGGVALATGIVVYLTAPAEHEPGVALRVTPTGGALSLRF